MFVGSNEPKIFAKVLNLAVHPDPVVALPPKVFKKLAEFPFSVPNNWRQHKDPRAPFTSP